MFQLSEVNTPEITVDKMFAEAFAKAKTIPFNYQWSNGVGYFDNAIYGVDAPKIGHGMLVRSVTPGGRRLLFIGTRMGNVVVFDRDDPAKDGSRYSYNTNGSIQKAFCLEELFLDTVSMGNLIGDAYSENIGERIEMIYNLCRKITNTIDK